LGHSVPAQHDPLMLRAALGRALKAWEARRAVLVWHGESFLRSKHGPWHAGMLSCRAGQSTALKKFSASFLFPLVI